MANEQLSLQTNHSGQTASSLPVFRWERDDFDKQKFRLFDESGREYQVIRKTGRSWVALTGEPFPSLELAKVAMEEWALNLLATEREEAASRASVERLRGRSGCELAHRYQTGTQVVSPEGEILGRLTSVFREDGRIFGVIDGEFEVDLAGSAEILDLMGHARAANASLDASFLRLGSMHRAVA